MRGEDQIKEEFASKNNLNKKQLEGLDKAFDIFQDWKNANKSLLLKTLLSPNKAESQKAAQVIEDFILPAIEDDWPGIENPELHKTLMRKTLMDMINKRKSPPDEDIEEGGSFDGAIFLFTKRNLDGRSPPLDSLLGIVSKPSSGCMSLLIVGSTLVFLTDSILQMI